MPKKNGNGAGRGDLWLRLYEEVTGMRGEVTVLRGSVTRLDKGLRSMGRLILRIRAEQRNELADIKRRLSALEAAQ
ncbi:MAG: hypothetical protein HYZ28_14370 [Myxococcales bacterium]|nr:hypothetical protein [Myxococcales bacterium]